TPARPTQLDADEIHPRLAADAGNVRQHPEPGCGMGDDAGHVATARHLWPTPHPGCRRWAAGRHLLSGDEWSCGAGAADLVWSRPQPGLVTLGKVDRRRSKRRP